MLEEHIDTIPAGLDSMEPGPVLAGFLASIDVARVSAYDRIVVLRAHQRMASHYQARVYRDMAAVVDVMSEEEPTPEFAADAAAAEIRAALRLTRRAADTELAFALDLERRLPRLASLLSSGDIDARRARVIERSTVHLTDGAARLVVDRIADVAPQLTTGQLAARIRRLCIEAAPEQAADRFRRAVEDRRVVVEPNESGTANLMGLDLTPDRVAAISRRINAMARTMRGGGETRTMDQLRADVFMDLLSGKVSAGCDTMPAGVVDIRVDLDTLIGLSEHPGELAGYGPVIADLARKIAEDGLDAEWRYTITDTASGNPVANGMTRRRPTAGQRRSVESRDLTCVFPGCRMPATDCDLDHSIPWAQGGPTDEEHLAPLCRHDHITVRHGAGWGYRRLPGGGYRWTSRLGHTYTSIRRPP